MLCAGILGGREMAEADGPDPNADLPTQRLPGRGGEPLSSEEAASLAAHMMQPTVPGGPPRSAPPTLPDSQPPPTAGGRPPAGREASAPRPILGDRYELLEELGRGGMGVVYRAHDRTLGRDVALKVLLVAGRVDAETIGRFQREARAAAALDHPNIVRVHDVGALPDGAPYYTMEMLAGQDLAHAIADDQIAPKEAVEAIRQVSLALFYAHQKGILHRDLKPQNIFLRRDPARDPKSDAPTMPAGTPMAAGEVHALLLDFGLAKLAESDLVAHAEGSQGRKSMQSLTRTGEIFGTPAYMPPEQTHGAKDVDARADIYSLGAALYHALAGRTPFDAACMAELLYKVQRQDPSPPSQLNADIDADLDTLTLKCLQKDPKDRYQNAGELAEDLKRWLAGDPISARPIGFVGRVWRKARRNKAVAIPVAALSIVILVGLLAWAGIEVNRRVQFAAQTREAERSLAAAEAATAPVGGPDYIRARDLALAARVLYPKDEGVKGLLARICLSQARHARAAYEEARRKTDDLEAKEEEAQVAEAPKDDAERRKLQEDAWHREGGLKDARRGRGEALGAALVQFQEALVHVEGHPEAERALAELYWDEYLRAEKARDRAEEKRCEALVVRFGHEEYAAKVRGERDVKVVFHLPADFGQQAGSARAKEVAAYLFRYEPCQKPPILIPVPCDPKDQQAGSASGRLLVEVSTLAPARDAWMPVPLKEAAAPAAAGAPTIPPEELKSLEERAAKGLETKHYPDAATAFDRLTRVLPADATHPYNLACCLARAGEKEKALVALEEAVRRGWSDPKHTSEDEDLAELREEAGFQVLLAVMRGDLPRRHVRIDSIVADSPAAKASLHDGDVLVTIDGTKVETLDEVKAAIQGVVKGAPCVVVVRRGAAEEKVTAEGVPPLGVQLAQVDFTADSPSRFPWTELAPSEPRRVEGRVNEVRWGSVYRLDTLPENRVALRIEAGVARFALHLPKGSYLLYLPAGQGLYETRYPFEVARDYEWNETCDLVPTEAPPLPPGIAAPDPSHYWVYATPGPYRASGDQLAQQSPSRPSSVIRVPEGKRLADLGAGRDATGVWMARFEVTCEMYLEYLNDREWHKQCKPWDHVPRKASDAMEQTAYWPRDNSTGRFSNLDGWAEWPILAVSWNDATDYCKWLTARRGGTDWRFELPTEDEWERAARGPDGRFFPWGDSFDAAFCRMQDSRPEEKDLSPERFGLFPLDEGPFGVRDLAGGMEEMTSTISGAHGQWRIFKGGAWSGPPSICRGAFRNVSGPGSVGRFNGFRVAARRARP